MRGLFGRHRDRTLLATTVLMSGALLSLDEGTSLDVARALGATLYAPVQGLTRSVEDLVTLRRENRQLRRVVATLNLERMRLVQLRNEQQEMRRLARFATEHFPVLLPCEIVGRSTDREQDMLTIGRGSADSVRIDMPVTAYGGLVGRVRQATTDRALVEILSSPGFAVSCRDQRSGVIGILRWVRGNQFSLERVDAVEDVLVGDPLVSSGLGGIYPRGIPVGVVTRVENSLDGLFKQIEVRPYVDLGGLQDVFVVRRMVAWEDDALYGSEDRTLLQSVAAGRSADEPGTSPGPRTNARRNAGGEGAPRETAAPKPASPPQAPVTEPEED
jgi:rod shape-determining protein MreC